MLFMELRKVQTEKGELLSKLCSERRSHTRGQHKSDALLLENEFKIRDLNNKIKTYNHAIQELENLNDLMHNPHIKSFENGVFTSQLRQVVMTYISHRMWCFIKKYEQCN